MKKKLNILLVEDDRINAKTMAAFLKIKEWTLQVAENGNKAVDLWRSNHFDIILTDVKMPEMDGIEAVRIIREEEKKTGAHIPIIAVTALAMTDDRDKCLAAGMDDYISKPYHFDDLSAAITRVLRDRQEAKTDSV